MDFLKVFYVAITALSLFVVFSLINELKKPREYHSIKCTKFNQYEGYCFLDGSRKLDCVVKYDKAKISSINCKEK